MSASDENGGLPPAAPRPKNRIVAVLIFALLLIPLFFAGYCSLIGLTLSFSEYFHPTLPVVAGLGLVGIAIVYFIARWAYRRFW